MGTKGQTMDSSSSGTGSGASRESQDFKKRQEKKKYLKAMQHIAKIRMLDFHDLLYFGPNGAVAKLKNPFLRTDLAVKIEPFQDSSVIETWTKMNHVNVVPLIETIAMEATAPLGRKLRWTAYIMPFYPSTLAKQSFSRVFRESSNAFGQATNWIRQVIEAVRYMHKNGFFHLDIKEDNVLLNVNGNAVLADFTFVTTKSIVDKYYIGCPIPYKPPEAIVASDSKLHSENVDLWALGILILNVLTSGKTYKFIPELEKDRMEGWLNHLRPFILTIRSDYRKFLQLLYRSFPKHRFTSYEAEICWEFVKALLEEEPSRRLRASTLLKQDLMAYGDTGNFLKKISMQYLGACKSCATLISHPMWKVSKDSPNLSDCQCGNYEDIVMKQMPKNQKTMS